MELSKAPIVNEIEIFNAEQVRNYLEVLDGKR